MSPEALSDWLYQTDVSQFIQTREWIIPTLQSVHIVALSAVVGSALVLNLRLAGFMAVAEDGAGIARRYLPWLWRAVAVLALTGLTLVIGEPERSLFNPAFWTKMALLVVAAGFTIGNGRAARSLAEGQAASAAVRAAALFGLLLWAAVICAGRWIAYQF
jgi:hypothetical protein